MTVTTICFVKTTEYGVGEPLMAVVVNPNKYKMLMKWLLFYNIFGVITIGSVKISIAFFLLRIALNQWFRRFVYFMIGE